MIGEFVSLAIVFFVFLTFARWMYTFVNVFFNDISYYIIVIIYQ